MEDGAFRPMFNWTFVNDTGAFGLQTVTTQHFSFFHTKHTHTHTDTRRHFPGYLLTCLGGPGGAQSGAVEWFC